MFLLQKFPALDFTATTKLSFAPYKVGERAGLVIMGQDYATLSIEKTDKGLALNQTSSINAAIGKSEIINSTISLEKSELYMRVQVIPNEFTFNTKVSFGIMPISTGFDLKNKLSFELKVLVQ